MRNDIRFALRMIQSRRWFYAAVIAALALGIGLNTTVFSLVNGILFKPPSLPNGDRLVAISNRDLSRGVPRMPVSYPDYREFRSQATAFESLEAGLFEGGIISEEGNPPRRYELGRMSPGMFEMVRTAPVLGRGFVDADGEPGADPVILLGHGIWMERYGGSPGVIGRPVRVNGTPAAIVGVMPAGFQFPVDQDFWMPLVPTAQLEDRSQRSLMLFGVLKPEVSIAAATADVRLIARRIASEEPATNENIGTVVETFNQRFNGATIRLVFLLMTAAVSFVLLIACANVASMLLSRALARRREISLRAALGASRWRIIRQLLVESILLSCAGGLLGLLVTAFATHVFDRAVASVKPYWVDFSVDYSVLAYFAAVCLGAGLLFGLVPALKASRVDLMSALKDGTLAVGRVREAWLSGVLVVLQFTLVVILLTGAGVFTRAFLDNLRVNPWIPSDNILTARLDLPEERYPDTDARQRFYEQLLPRLTSLPGVAHAAVVSNPPGTGAMGSRIDIEGAPAAGASLRPSAAVVALSPGYFRLIGLPLLAGRDFEFTDGTPGREAAIVTGEFAARFWPNQQAVGRRFRTHNYDKPGDWITVVGVCGDISQQPNVGNPDPPMFLPWRREGFPAMTLLVRTSGEPSAVAAAVRAEVQQLDSDLPLYDVMSLRELQHSQRWYLRVFGTLFFVFALLALLMASIGVYAVVAQSVVRRTQEIGVRVALGATSGSVLRLVMARGMKQLLAGLVLGLTGAFAATRYMAGVRFRVTPGDPVVLGSIALVLIAVGLLASWLPARRAVALHPVRALRHE